MKGSKDKIEQMCRAAGLTPQARYTVNGHEICTADGFVLMPEVTFKRMGVEPGEFPNGAWVTMWWLAKQEGKFLCGEPIFFDAFHDSDMEASTKKQARLNTARLRAKEATSMMGRSNG